MQAGLVFSDNGVVRVIPVKITPGPGILLRSGVMGQRQKKKGSAHSSADNDSVDRNEWGRLTGWLVVLAVVIVAVGTMVLIVRSRPSKVINKPRVAVRNDVLAAETTDPRMEEVERTLFCPCGNCNLKLSKCTCDNANGALEVKKTIVALLESGLDVKAVAATLSSRFPGSLRNTKTTPEVVEQPMETASGDSFAAVVAKLHCLCGNCRKLLAECECAHRNGAIEVKTFIKKRLAEGFSGSDVLSAVKRVYGSRLFHP